MDGPEIENVYNPFARKYILYKSMSLLRRYIIYRIHKKRNNMEVSSSLEEWTGRNGSHLLLSSFPFSCSVFVPTLPPANCEDRKDLHLTHPFILLRTIYSPREKFY